MIVTKEAFEGALRWIREQDELAVDTETTGLEIWKQDRVIGIAVSNGENSYYFPFKHNDGYNLPHEYMPKLYLALLDIPHLIFFNAKFDLQAMYRDGFERSSGFEDVMISAHMMNENEPSFGLKKLADRYLGEGSSKDEAELTKLIKSRYGQKAKKGEIWRLRSDEVAPYACSDTYLTYTLREFYKPHLKTWGLSQLHSEVNDYNAILNEMQIYGVLMDVAWIHDMRDRIGPMIEEATKKIQSQVGYEINPNSPIQLKEYFGTPSTDKETLEILEDPVAADVLEFRGLKKINSTYLTSYENLMDEQNIIHANLNVTGTVAGRLSSSDPNLQNVPKIMRRAFIARPGRVLVEADYSTAELRLAAYFSKCARLMQIFREGGDPHQMVADEMSNLMGKQIDRQVGKIINFGKIYGMGANGFSRKFDITMQEAERYVQAYDSRFPEIKDLYYSMQQQAANKGYIRLPTGRVRRYPRGNFQTAMNNLIQGTAAEVVRHAMMRIHKHLPEARMLLQVHDSILCEVEEGNLEYTLPRIRGIMEDFNFNPRMKADFKVGHSWGEMDEVHVT